MTVACQGSRAAGCLLGMGSARHLQGGQVAGGRKEKPGFGALSAKASTDPRGGSLELGQPFSVDSNWGEKVAPSYCVTSWDVGCSRGLCQGGSLQLGQCLEWGTGEGRQWQHSQQKGHKSLGLSDLKGKWWCKPVPNLL